MNESQEDRSVDIAALNQPKDSSENNVKGKYKPVHNHHLPIAGKDGASSKVAARDSSASTWIKSDVKPKTKMEAEAQPGKTAARSRVRASFWMLGLCNNYGYVVMISAAYDILDKNFGLAEVMTRVTRACESVIQIMVGWKAVLCSTQA